MFMTTCRASLRVGQASTAATTALPTPRINPQDPLAAGIDAANKSLIFSYWNEREQYEAAHEEARHDEEHKEAPNRPDGRRKAKHTDTC